MPVVKINYKKCIGCKKCWEICPMDVYKWDEEKDMPVAAYEDECWFCGCCWMECPKRAIDFNFPASFW